MNHAIEDFNKFYTMKPQKYYDCGGEYGTAKAREMIENVWGDCIATRKNDGEWARCIVDNDGRITIQSRSISKVTGQYGDKTELVPHIVEELRSFSPGTVLLGELCFEDVTTTSRDVGSILRCKAPKAIERQRTGPKLVLKVFDCLALEGVDLMKQPYEHRLAMAKASVFLFCRKYITMTDIYETDFEDHLLEILAEGGEGIVIHRKSYLYSPGGRPAWQTLKVKKTIGELELLVVDFIAPKRLHEGTEPANYLNWLYWECWYTDRSQNKFLVENPCADDYYNTTMTWEPVTKPYFKGWKNGVIVNYNGNQVRVASGLTDADREWLATDEAREALTSGQLVAVVGGMELTTDSIRHPRLIRLRTDA